MRRKHFTDNIYLFGGYVCMYNIQYTRHLAPAKSVFVIYSDAFAIVRIVINHVYQNNKTKHFARLFWQTETIWGMRFG